MESAFLGTGFKARTTCLSLLHAQPSPAVLYVCFVLSFNPDWHIMSLSLCTGLEPSLPSVFAPQIPSASWKPNSDCRSTAKNWEPHPDPRPHPPSLKLVPQACSRTAPGAAANGPHLQPSPAGPQVIGTTQARSSSELGISRTDWYRHIKAPFRYLRAGQILRYHICSKTALRIRLKPDFWKHVLAGLLLSSPASLTHAHTLFVPLHCQPQNTV